MFKKINHSAFAVFLTLFYTFPLSAQETKPGKVPPAAVVVSEVKNGFVAPEAEFIGTVFYLEVSDVAAEVRFLPQRDRIKASAVLSWEGSSFQPYLRESRLNAPPCLPAVGRGGELHCLCDTGPFDVRHQDGESEEIKYFDISASY